MDVLRLDRLIALDENTTSSAGELSGFTNTLLPKNPSISFDHNGASGAEGSQTPQIDCFGRLRAFRSTKIVLLAPRVFRHYK